MDWRSSAKTSPHNNINAGCSCSARLSSDLIRTPPGIEIPGSHVGALLILRGRIQRLFKEG